MAEQVIRSFASQLNEADGQGLTTTGMEEAALHLTGTTWETGLRRAIVREFCERPEGARLGPGGVLGKIGWYSFQQKKIGIENWLNNLSNQLEDNNEEVAVEAALQVMESAFQETAQPIPLIVTALLNRLSGSAAMSCAAAWALGWMNYQEKNQWKPQPDETEKMVKFLRHPEADPDAICFIMWILSKEKIPQAVEPLAFWSKCLNPHVRKEVGETLWAIGGVTASNVLISQLKDSDKIVREAALANLAQTLSKNDLKLIFNPDIS